MASKQRRVLGAPDSMEVNTGDHVGAFSSADSTISATNETSSSKQDYDTSKESREDSTISDEQKEELRCPICDESMITLQQLNQHIDDVHEQITGSEPDQTRSKHIKPPKRNDKLPQASKVLSPSAEQVSHSQSSSSVGAINTRRINKKYFESIAPESRCSFPSCQTHINPRSNITNCFKCGRLYCRKHLGYRVRLSISEDSANYDSIKGGWCVCCKDCFYKKPEFSLVTDVAINDLTPQFNSRRQIEVDRKALAREQSVTRFIKLTNHLASEHFKNTSPWSRLLESFTDDDQQKLLGLETWQDDKSVTNCSICFVGFSFLIRKHHCRICGRIVCENLDRETLCSINIPLSKIIEKLIDLNYSPLVRSRFKELVQNDSIKFRCCIDCKNDLFYEWKLNQNNSLGDEIHAFFESLSSFLLIKTQVCNLLPEYENMVNSDHHDSENTNEEFKRVANKLMSLLKSVESTASHCKATYFEPSEQNIVKAQYAKYAKLIKNVYQSIVFFLQDKLVSFKSLSDMHKAKEQEKIRLLESQKEVKRPRLTKKQIKEYREQLMVLNEQKFMIQSMINNYTKARKFEELRPLKENEKELEKAIEAVETQLGEFAF